MRTASIQIVCRGCGHPYRTTVRGSSTRCRTCGTQRYVRVDQQWEGPAADAAVMTRAAETSARTPVELSCNACGHEWQSRAALGTVLRCPECRHPRRITLDARDQLDAPPAPPARSATPVRQPSTPAPARRIPPPPAPRSRPARPASSPLPPAGGIFGLLGTLLGGRASQASTTRPPALPTAVTRSPAAPSPARPARPAPAPVRPHPSSVLEILGFQLAPPNARFGGLAGYCELASGRPELHGRDCGAPRAFYIGLPDRSVIYVCEGHRYALERAAVRKGIPMDVAPLH